MVGNGIHPMRVTVNTYAAYGCPYGRYAMWCSCSSTDYAEGTTSECPGYTYDVMLAAAKSRYGFDPSLDTFVYNGVATPPVVPQNCTIQSVHFLKNSSASFDCNAQPGDILEIEMTVTGTGNMTGIVEYDSPYQIGDSVPFSFGVLSGGSKTMSIPISKGTFPSDPHHPGTYRIRGAYVFVDNMATLLCQKVF